MDRAAEFEAALMAMDRVRARKVFMAAADEGGVLPSMESLMAIVLDRIGEAWEAGDAALSQVYMAGRICEELSLELLPGDSGERKREPAIAVATFDNHHFLGKRMVLSTLRDAGYAAEDWARVDTDYLLRRLSAEPVDFILLSCLMLSSALRIGPLKARLSAEHPKLKVVVGGAPFRIDPELWKEVGADAAGTKASDSVSILRRFTEASS